MSKPKLVPLFDIGGVIIELEFKRAFAYWSKLSGIPAATILERMSMDSAYQQHERGEIDFSAYCVSLRNSLGIELSDAELLHGWNDIYVGEVVGMNQLLTTLSQQTPCYAFSNSNWAHQEKWQVLFADILAHFERVFVSSEMGVRKPERESFEHVAAAIGVPLQSLLFFDDTEENVVGAEQAGVQAVLVHSIADVERALHSAELIP